MWVQRPCQLGIRCFKALQVGLGGINENLWGHCKSMLASMTISSTHTKNLTRDLVLWFACSCWCPSGISIHQIRLLIWVLNFIFILFFLWGGLIIILLHIYIWKVVTIIYLNNVHYLFATNSLSIICYFRKGNVSLILAFYNYKNCLWKPINHVTRKPLLINWWLGLLIWIRILCQFVNPLTESVKLFMKLIFP